MKNIRELANNRQNDIFRAIGKLFYAGLLFALGFLVCYYVNVEIPVQSTTVPTCICSCPTPSIRVVAQFPRLPITGVK